MVTYTWVVACSKEPGQETKGIEGNLDCPELTHCDPHREGKGGETTGVREVIGWERKKVWASSSS
jgi:hypothetical protein